MGSFVFEYKWLDVIVTASVIISRQQPTSVVVSKHSVFIISSVHDAMTVCLRSDQVSSVYTPVVG